MEKYLGVCEFCLPLSEELASPLLTLSKASASQRTNLCKQIILVNDAALECKLGKGILSSMELMLQFEEELLDAPSQGI